MTIALLIVALALVWIAVSGSASGLTALTGVLVAILTLLLLRHRIGIGPWLRRVGRIIGLAGFFLRALIASALRVAVLTITPGIRGRLRPAIVAVPLTIRSDNQVTLLSSLVTLTPGTLSVDVGEGNAVLYVHVLEFSNREAVIAEITQGFEARIRGVFA